MSGRCLNDQNVSKWFICSVRRIFCRYLTGDRTIFEKCQELNTFCRVPVGENVWNVCFKVVGWVPEKFRFPGTLDLGAYSLK